MTTPPPSHRQRPVPTGGGGPGGPRRSCSKPTCGEPATATVTYDHGGRRIELIALTDTPLGAAAFAVCEPCAERLRPPRGWVLEDRRPVQRSLPLHVVSGLAS